MPPGGPCLKGMLPSLCLSVVLAVPAIPLEASDPARPAGAVDPALFAGLRWRSIGPFRGGRVLAVAGVPGEREHFYFGGVNGGVWETDDAGRTWRPIFDAQQIGAIGALTLAPSNPKVIYVGTGEADMRSDIAQGDGIYKSTDGGKTFSHAGLSDSQQIGRILVDPRDPNRVLVAALGHPYGPNAERGVFLSTDGGRGWRKVLYRDENTGAVDLALKPGDRRVVYAALWQTRRPPWNVYPPSHGPGSGLYRSTDGGETWAEIRGHGFPADPGRIGLAVAPNQPNRVYAMVDAEKGGLYRSDDEGASWTRTSGDPRIWGRGWYFGGIAVEPRDADVVYACNTSIYRSKDGGKTFTPIKGAPGGDDYHELWIDPDHSERRILGSDQGASVSLNGGETWSSWYNQPTGQFYRVATDSRFPYSVYGSQQDSGAAGIPSRTTLRDGINMTQFRMVTAGGENDSIAPDPRDPDVIFGGRVEKFDLRTLQTHTLDPELAFPGRHRSVWTLPLVFSRRDSRVLYFADEQLFRTADGGRSWSAISPDLTREEPGVPPNLDPTTAADDGGTGPRRGVIYTIAPSRVADGDLWIGTDDGLIWRSRDEGGHWADITPPSLSSWSKIAMLEVSHVDVDTAWAAVDRHRLDDFAPYIYRTRDGGKSWTLSVSGIPLGSFVNAVREDLRRPGLLYAGTEKGMYVSFDGGDRWQPLQLNLPMTSVRDVDVHGDDVVIATHGRALWILDDVTPLRQVDAEVAHAKAWLFAPASAVRVRPAGFTGTPIPMDEPRAANPPLGAAIDYVLGQAPAGALTLSILDEKGDLVRRYSSADRLPPLSRAESRLAPEWLTPPVVLPATPGMHRTVWPLRYPAPPTLAKGNTFADGVWAPPGRYTVELRVDGQRMTRPLVVEPDPRVGLAPEAYGRQFELARKVERAREVVASAMQEAEALHKELLARVKASSSGAASSAGSLAHAMANLDAQALALSEVAESSPRSFPGPPQSLSSFRFLEGALEKLDSAVDGADVDPTPDARTGFMLLDSTLTRTLAAWEALKTGNLAALNAGLQQAGQPPIALKPER
ncbi:MAG: WD40/YVTN/BNR-like repeat-containing protein [Thermoanaerobaculia bacterium]